MGTIADALTWSGSEATLSLFTVSRENIIRELPPAPSLPPTRTRAYALEDDGNALPGRHVFEYDFSFAVLPSNLEEIVTHYLKSARANGAEVAWFGFEGSFSFELLLTASIANQIYAIADSNGLSVASDTMLHSNAWQERIARAGSQAHDDTTP